MKAKYIAIVAAVLAAAGVAWWLAAGSGGDVADDAVTETGKGNLLPSAQGKSSRRVAVSGSSRDPGSAGGAKHQGLWSTIDDDSRELNELEKSILKQIRDGLDSKNLRTVRKAIAQFYAPKERGGLDCRVPKELRQQALEALIFFRPDSISDIVQFMADRDEEIVEDAFAKFELELDDWSIGDRERADVLVQVMRALNDTERIDPLLNQFNNMRNSVKVDTAQRILQSGSSQAKALMQEQLGFYFDADVEKPEQLADWKKNNPDEPTDEEFYGPKKEDE